MIRQLEPSDSSTYFQVRLDVLRLNPEAFATGAEDWSKATDEQVRNLLEKSDQDDFVLGAFQNGELAGVVGFKREKKHSVAHKGTIWGLAVLPCFRNQGIGKKLLKALISRASMNPELEYIRAVVTISDPHAKHVFNTLGFTCYGTEQHGIKEGSRFFDQAFMSLSLRK